jgi:NAD(P)-dependent dehydrogenase (short-subunit alcohol dehydrogenase family)
MARFKNKVVLVTGGAQGIGAAIAESFAEQGAQVAIVDRNSAKAEETASRLAQGGFRAKSISVDISTREGCESAIGQAVTEFGALDFLVNNAAPGRNKAFIGKLSEADWDEHARVVLQAAVWLTDFAEPHLKLSSAASIVNVTSVIATKIGLQHCSWPYHATKAGLEQLTRYLACRLGEYNIRVNAVSPGLVDRSEGMKLIDDPTNKKIIENNIPLKRAATEAEIGGIVAFLCSEEASYLTGQTLVVDGGLELNEVFAAVQKFSGLAD